ncbi:MAG: hypothetical protein JSU61_09150 [Fidelibacterota bacterium]|nr:MAG: hypothetical protein JSU61_09150 [Candidatus Neomarinimicrobiota bacterium]
MHRISALILFTLLLVGQSLRADQRHYVWTYEYLTVPAGQGEVEVYHTSSAPRLDRLEGQVSLEQQLELEVGMTDRFDFAIYGVFGQEPDGPFQFKGHKLRARYRFGERNRYVVDPLLYLEYKGKPDFSEHELEAKLIISKDLGLFNISFNPVLEFENEHGEWEWETGYALGTSLMLGSTLHLGLEAQGSGHGHYLGPVIAHGNEHLWVALGSAFAVSSIKDGASEFQLRLLLGIGL